MTSIPSATISTLSVSSTPSTDTATVTDTTQAVASQVDQSLSSPLQKEEDRNLIIYYMRSRCICADMDNLCAFIRKIRSFTPSEIKAIFETGKAIYLQKNIPDEIMRVFITELLPAIPQEARIQNCITMRDMHVLGVDLRNAQLSYVGFCNVNMSGVAMYGANCQGATFHNVCIGQNLENVNFRDASLGRMDFRSKNVSWVDFRGAFLHDAKFQDVNLNRADFRGAQLRGASFYDSYAHTSLVDTDFRGTDLHGVHFGCTVYGARMGWAQWVDLRVMQGRGANIEADTL